MIRVEQGHLPVAALTHPGMTGKNNEDCFAISAYRLGKHDPTPSLLAVLSDGIGGHRGGEVAAEMAVTLISKYLAEGDGRYPPEMLEHAIQESSRKIYDRAQQDHQLLGMGATAVVAWVIGRRLYTANIGDSRLYLLRGGEIYQISNDHTWVQEALEKGLIRPEEVAGHPNSHIIRRFLGSPTPPEVDLHLHLHVGEGDDTPRQEQGLLLDDQDIILLCSDGLTDLVGDAEILAAFVADPLNEAVQGLVNLACERGGHDNITLVAMQMPAQPLIPMDSTSIRGVKSCLILGIALLVTSVLAVLAFWGYATYLDRQVKPTPTATVGSLPTHSLPLDWIVTGTPGQPTPKPARTPPPTAVFGPLSTEQPINTDNPSQSPP